MRTSIATVCLSGDLIEKLHACAEAGFDGVEIFEPVLTACPNSPEEVRALASRLGLRLELFQPFRDFEGVDEECFAANMRRAEAKFRLMRRLGMDLILVCSNVDTATIDSDELSAQQLRALGELAATYDVRVAFEALAWGKYVDDYRRAWRIVQLADHPNVGICLDSFHILSRGHDPSEIENIPGEKIFFLQLADAPNLSMDVLSWSRHHRLFPGEGSFDLTTFVSHVVRAGYEGPLSLEIFNDTFRQTDVRRTARHALRSLHWLEDAVASAGAQHTKVTPNRLPRPHAPADIDFVEIKAEDTTEVEVVLGQLGFTFRGRHRSKPVRLWTAGSARVVLNEQQARDHEPHVAAIGFEVSDPDEVAARAEALLAPKVYRRTYESEFPLQAVCAPDGTEIFFSVETSGQEPPWSDEFEGGSRPGREPVRRIDHINLAQPWEDFDEAVLFYASLLQLKPETRTNVASLHGLVRSQVMRTEDGRIRIPLNLAPPASATLPQHIAFETDDVLTLARNARARGLKPLPVPQNYYEDLAARYDIDETRVAQLRDAGVLYERDATGEFLHFYTPTIGDVFFEAVERVGGYDGYGATNAPIRLAAQSSVQ